MGRLIDADKLRYKHSLNTENTTMPQSFPCITKDEINNAPTVETIPKNQYETRLKADMAGILEELKTGIEEVETFKNVIGWELTPKTPTNIKQDCIAIIQDKINELKADQERGRMTNGEKIREVFPKARIKYHKATDLVDEYVTVFINGCDTCQNYSMEWWNAEYKDPTTKNDLGVDCISRKAVDRIINKWLSHPDYELKDHIYFMTEKIHSLPSVTPQEPRKGHWIRVAGGSLIDDYRCDCCNHQPPIRKVGSTWGWVFTDYCPNCGAKMESEVGE